MNKRLVRLLRFLLEQDGFTTYQSLSEVMNVSVSTIRADIHAINEMNEYDGPLIEMKRGVGVKLHNNEDTTKVIAELINMYSSLDNKSIQGENAVILKYLVQNINQVVTIQQLSDLIHMSNSYVQKKIIELRKLFQTYDVTLQTIPGKGILIEGDETQIRSLFIKVLFKSDSEVVYREQKALNQYIIDTLHLNSEHIFKAISKSEVSLGSKFTDESYQSLAIHIAIAIKRIIDGTPIDDANYNYQIVDKWAYNVAKILVKDIEKAYNVKFIETEIYYVYLHLISTKVSMSVLHEDIKDSNRIVTKIAQQIVSLVEDIRHIKVNEEYLNTLIMHLRPAINRLEFNLTLNNPLIDNIRNEYPEAYGIAWMCNPIFSNELNKNLDEHEVGYLALHIQAMMESTKTSTRVIIVCSSGVGISQLIRTQVEGKFPDLTILSTESVMEFPHSIYLNQTDFVISTFPIDTTKPVVIVNPILQEEDIQKIREFLKKNVKENSHQDIVKTVFLKQEWSSKYEVIKKVSQYLLKTKQVLSPFEDSVIRREEVNTTEIGNYIALPHGASPYVIESQLVIVTLKEKILWDEYEVDVIIFILITDNEKDSYIQNLQNVYKKMYTDEFHESVVKANSEEEVKRLF